MENYHSGQLESKDHPKNKIITKVILKERCFLSVKGKESIPMTEWQYAGTSFKQVIKIIKEGWHVITLGFVCLFVCLFLIRGLDGLAS